MTQGKGQRILLTVYTVAWLLLLMAVYCVLVETLSCHLRHAYEGGELPSFTKHIAVPLIGGVHAGEQPSWQMYVGWGVLFVWPVGNLALVWACKDLGRMRRGLAYSCVGYGLYVFAVALVLTVGLAMPFAF